MHEFGGRKLNDINEWAYLVVELEEKSIESNIITEF